MRLAVSIAACVLMYSAGAFAIAVIVRELRKLPARWSALCAEIDRQSDEWR